MNAAQLLVELQRREVRLWVEGERLSFEAPSNALTPQVLAAMKASKRELLALLATPEPQVLVADLYDPGAARVVEITRPDILSALGLPALDADPPEPAPYHPAAHAPAVWIRDVGVWGSGPDGLWRIPTAATRANALRLYEARVRLAASWGQRRPEMR